jgi:hypothetical protein
MRGRRSASLLLVGLALLACLNGCGGNSDNAHTTATTIVPPPPHQSLTVVIPTQQPTRTAIVPDARDMHGVNSKAPLLHFALPNGSSFRIGQLVPLNITVSNAKLKGDGGEFRIRYIVDDGEMRWIDDSTSIALSGWVPGEHTIRVELIGPDGWPYKNGEANVVTRKITFSN